jgi:transposase-like protein
MRSQIADLRVQVQRCQHPDRPRAARYPAALRSDIVQLAGQARASGRSLAAVARSLGAPPQLIQRWVRSQRPRRPAVRPVVITAEPSMAPSRSIVTLPSGIRIEGLAASEIATLLRTLV